MPNWDADYDSLKGCFFVLDGPDGAGKTTVRQEVARRLREASIEVTECRDPGGTVTGDRIRGILLDHDLAGMDVRCETLLFMASRAQLVSESIRPALNEGHVVLCDRFVSSTCAYQVAAGNNLGSILSLARFAVGSCWPDLTLVLDVPVDIGFNRIGQRSAPSRTGGNGAGSPGPAVVHDSMERRPVAFHQAVRDNFLQLPLKYPSPVEIVDATPPLPEVVDQILERLLSFAHARLSTLPG
jgi:dTMP kinase